MKTIFIYFSIISLLLLSCNIEKDPIGIIEQTIKSIDTINTIYYQQTHFLGSSDNIENVVQKERTFYYERLKTDSLIGAKAHIYFFDSTFIFLEDIYDGNKLIRKLNRDSSVRIYDLVKYPELLNKPFWGKTTPYVIQYMIKYAIDNKEFYSFSLENDTVINQKKCYKLKTVLRKKALMPGFYKSEIDTNRVETMILFIDKMSFYPQKIRMEVYFIDNPKNVYFTDNNFYNLKFNIELSDSLFDTSEEIVKGFTIDEIKP